MTSQKLLNITGLFALIFSMSAATLFSQTTTTKSAKINKSNVNIVLLEDDVLEEAEIYSKNENAVGVAIVVGDKSDLIKQKGADFVLSKIEKDIKAQLDTHGMEKSKVFVKLYDGNDLNASVFTKGKIFRDEASDTDEFNLRALIESMDRIAKQFKETPDNKSPVNIAPQKSDERKMRATLSAARFSLDSNGLGISVRIGNKTSILQRNPELVLKQIEQKYESDFDTVFRAKNINLTKAKIFTEIFDGEGVIISAFIGGHLYIDEASNTWAFSSLTGFASLESQIADKVKNLPPKKDIQDQE